MLRRASGAPASDGDGGSGRLRAEGASASLAAASAEAGGAKPPGVKIDIVTIFPAMVQAPLSEGVVGRAAGAECSIFGCTTFGTTRLTAIASWTTCRLVAGRAWC